MGEGCSKVSVNLLDCFGVEVLLNLQSESSNHRANRLNPSSISTWSSGAPLKLTDIGDSLGFSKGGIHDRKGNVRASKEVGRANVCIVFWCFGKMRDVMRDVPVLSGI
jgi:hypothetical protein